MERESHEKLLSYPPSSSIEMETLMKRPEVTLKDTENADKWKTKIINMLETKFASIILKSSTDVGRTNLHTVDLQVMETQCLSSSTLFHLSIKVSLMKKQND